MTREIEFSNRSGEVLHAMIEPRGVWFDVPSGSRIKIQGAVPDLSSKVQVEYREPKWIAVWMDDLDYEDMNITIVENRF